MNEKIEILNDITLSSNSFLSELTKKFEEIKNKLEIHMQHEISVEISNIFERITSNFIPNYQTKINKYINFFTELENLSGGIKYEELQSILKSHDKQLLKRLRNLGLSLIKKKPSRLIGNINSAKSINNNQWIEIVGSLKNNVNFIKSARNLNNLLKIEIEKHLDEELIKAKKKYPDLSDQQITEFKKKYLAEKINIEEYITRFAPKSMKTKVIKSQHLQKNEINLFDEKQEKREEDIDFDNYNKYFQASDRELSRMKRMGIYDTGSKKKKSRRIKKNNNGDKR